MPRFRVLVTAMHLSPEAQALLADAGGDIVFMPEPIDEDALVAHLAAAPTAAIILRGSRPITAQVLAAGGGHLKIVAKNGAGVDSVDLDAATRRGVAVMVAAGANADAVAEHAVALMLALTRDLPRLDARVRAGGWATTAHQGRDFRGSSVGIVGYGGIGRATAKSAAALGARVVVWARSPASAGRARADGFEADNLDELLARSDVLSLHCPLTDETRGLIGARELALMKPDALLVNTARGAVVDEAALVDALRNGRLAGAGLDTFQREPLDAASPLLALDNVILTPHVAGVTRSAVLRVSTLAATNVVDWLDGRPVDRANVVNPAVLDG